MSQIIQNNHLYHPQKHKGSLLQRFRRAAERNAHPLAMYVPWTLPKWLMNRGMAYYFTALIVVSLMYSAYSMPWYYMLSGAVSVLLFFAYGRNLSKRISLNTIKKSVQFEQKIFIIALSLRLIWLLVKNFIYYENERINAPIDDIDAITYQQMGVMVAKMLNSGNYHLYEAISKTFHFDISDMGYGTYVGLIYYVTNNSVFAVYLLKCMWSALMVVFVYRLASRNFGPQTARIAAIFCALWPNFLHYSACLTKETEMNFLVVLFIEQADKMLRSRQFTVWKIMPVLLIAGSLFTVRTVVAIVAILALLVTIVMSSSKVVSWGKRITIGTAAVLLIGISMGDRIEREANQLINEAQNPHGKTLEYRAQEKDGNKFATYAGAAVFAPMIFTIPFASYIDVAKQYIQEFLNGGNYIKNILSFFIILSLFIMLFSGSWRDHMLPLAFMLGYVLVLVMSNYAHSERFHQPAMPFEMMFAAYGLSIVMSNRKFQQWFKVWCVIMLVAAVAWNWFKLAGRGLV